MSHTDPAPVVPPLSAEQLPDDPELLKGMILELLACLQEHQRDKAALEHRLGLLLKRLYGPRGERFDPNQPLLFADTEATEATTIPAARSATSSGDPPLVRPDPATARRFGRGSSVNAIPPCQRPALELAMIGCHLRCFGRGFQPVIPQAQPDHAGESLRLCRRWHRMSDEP